MRRSLLLVMILLLLSACGSGGAGVQPTSDALETPVSSPLPTTTATATATPTATATAVLPTPTASAAAQATVIYQALGTGSVEAIDTATGSRIILADPTQPQQRLPWSAAPDGNTIAVITGRWQTSGAATQIERAALWTVAVNGMQPRKLLDLVPTGFGDAQPDLQMVLTDERFQTLAWTPDGQTIVVVSAHEGQLDLYAVAVDGSGARRLTNTPALEFQPSLSPDGRELSYGSAATFGTGAEWSNVGAWAQPLDGGERRAISGQDTSATASATDDTAAAEQLPDGALPVGWNGPARYFFAPQADNPGRWQLYRRADGADQAVGQPLDEQPVSPRLITSDTPLPLVVPTSTPTAQPDPTVQPTAQPTPPPAASPAFDELRGTLETLIAEWAGEHAVSVTDLQTGQTIAVNGARPQLAACTVKIVMMMAVAQDIEAGRYTEAEVDGLVRAAMGPSYTPPARDLIQRIGGGDIGAGIRRINEIMWGLGATNSILTHPPGYFWEEYGYADSHGTSENRLTTDDLSLILSKLYRGEALSPWATEYVLKSMTIAPDWMDQPLRGPLPADAQLYHKIGQLYEPENTWNDAGIVVFERGGQRYAYVISYLGSYGPSWQDAYAHATTLSDTVWRYFSAAYP
ncbi:MAG TPA: serine hydrolase [Herpetosiphonaceae bacterium]